MKVLVITYYWPPAGGSGVQRWLKFVKYLPEFGIDPIVFTVKDPSYAVEDASLLAEIPKEVKVFREQIWEPNALIEKFKGKKAGQSAGFLEANPTTAGKFMHYVRANYFIPDARKFWIKPAVKRLKKIIEENDIEIIITTGPPHSMHLIGLKLKELTDLKWLADFRDPWTNIDYFHNLPLTKRALKKHHNLEDKVLGKADAVVVVGNQMKKEFDDRNKQVVVLTNGFDDESETEQVGLDQKFSISHIGMMNADRNPIILWKALKELVEESESFSDDLRVKLIGHCDEEVNHSIHEHGLAHHVSLISYVAHKDVAKYQKSSQLLLLAVNKVPSAKGVVTGKVFEYMQSKRPIIGIGPIDGDLAHILRDTSSGYMVDFEDIEGLKKVLKEQYVSYKKGTLEINSKNVERYHRKNLSKDLADLINRL